MSDELISKQAVLDALLAKMDTIDDKPEVVLGMAVAMGMIKALPSALEQDPCDDEYIKVPKKALKYRTAGMVAYNAEWLKAHFDLERVVICGVQEPCDDAISREAVLDLCDSKDEEYKVRHFREDVECLPPVTLQPCGDCISRQAAIDLADELKDDLPDDDSLSDIVMSHNEGILEYQTKLSLLPSVTPAGKVGHWMQTGDFFINKSGQFVYQFICSECSTLSYFRKSNKKIIGADICPNCGAKMQEVDE